MSGTQFISVNCEKGPQFRLNQVNERKKTSRHTPGCNMHMLKIDFACPSPGPFDNTVPVEQHE